MEKKSGEKEKSRNIFNKKSYFSTFSNYNNYNSESNRVEKVDKGISTVNTFNFSNDFTLKISKGEQISKILSLGNRTKYKSIFNPKNLKTLNFKNLSDDYINNILDSKDEINYNLPQLTVINSDRRINLLNKMKHKSTFSEDKQYFHPHYFYVKKALNFNEKLYVMDKCNPTIEPKFHYGRFKLLLEKQNDKNLKIVKNIKKEMIKSNDLLKVYVNRLINQHLGQKIK